MAISEEEIMKKFLSINDSSATNTSGKYASIHENFKEDLLKFQSSKKILNYAIRPLQFTFEITNKCNCNCKDCGMAANRLNIDRADLTREQLMKIVDSLSKIGIPSIAITGGEPFLKFDDICYLINYLEGKLDVIKLITNGFWGVKADYYFKKLEESGLFNNKFFVPTIQISIGEQSVPLEHICNIIKYVTDNYSVDKLHLGIIHTRERNLVKSRLQELYEIYIKKYGDFPSGKVYLTDSYYVNSNPTATEKIDAETESAYELIATCDETFCEKLGKFVSPKIFMKCNGYCYPCEIFNTFDLFYLGNMFRDGIDKILDNYNSNKYIKFIANHGTVGFRDVLSNKFLKSNEFETVCCACEFCIKICEEKGLLR